MLMLQKKVLKGSLWTLPFITACAWAQDAAPILEEGLLEEGLSQAEVFDSVDLERSSGFEVKPEFIGEKYMVVAANPIAAAIGAEILEQGGSAADAFVAVSLALGIVEPQSSGIAGGGFGLYYDASSKQVIAYDGRETAPAKVDPYQFTKVLESIRSELPFDDAVINGKSVGTPGQLAMLELVHKKHGKIAWEDVLKPVITLAEEGFPVSPRLHELLVSNKSRFQKFADDPGSGFSYYYDEQGEPLAVGVVLKNPEFAEVLKRIAHEGAQAFYTGEVAENIVEAVQRHGGSLSLEDLANYEVAVREPLCFPYRQYNICGFGMPSSGTLTVAQILELSDLAGMHEQEMNSPEALHIWGEAMRLAYADREKYMADSDFVEVPVQGLLNSTYLTNRAKLINSNYAQEEVFYGEVIEGLSQSLEDMAQSPAIEFPSTTHLSIVDAEGNAFSVTQTIENTFGSTIRVNGFMLNNELTDFAFSPEVLGLPVANAIEPGKRPRSSMAPIIALDSKGELEFLVGSPGGSRIIPYVARVIKEYVDDGLSFQESLQQGHYNNRFGTYELEQGSPIVESKTALEAKGHTVVVRTLTSGLHAISLEEDDEGKVLLKGSADPRREGWGYSDLQRP